MLAGNVPSRLLYVRRRLSTWVPAELQLTPYHEHGPLYPGSSQLVGAYARSIHEVVGGWLERSKVLDDQGISGNADISHICILQALNHTRR